MWSEVFLLAFVTVSTVLASPSEDAQRRRDAGFRECIDGWVDRISDHCKYPGQAKPCFHGAGDPTVEPVDVYKVAFKCCTAKCAADAAEKFCCRHADCISHCYGFGRFPLPSSFFPRSDYEE
ncbi:hypothetical protein AAVH_01307 [Aphelenchoides avenae]|nr:hypothetical protein AAVH_01307 [Aphelenchus avenae]